MAACWAGATELRGLLGAYQAKAARLGAAEDPGLTERYDRARGLLWTAPCDLPAAADAVTSYQQAVLALEDSANDDQPWSGAQPGCGGTIEDGYCDTLRAGPGAAAAPGSAGSGASGPSASVRFRELGAVLRILARVPARGRGTGGAAGRRGAASGAGLVEIPPGALPGPGQRGAGRPAGAGEQAVLRQLRPAGRPRPGRPRRA